MTMRHLVPHNETSFQNAWLEMIGANKIERKHQFQYGISSQ